MTDAFVCGRIYHLTTMRTAVLGDIHANLEALIAVLADAQKLGCSEFVCTGDIVGYNASPMECLNIVRDLGCPAVRGNHDEDSSTETPLVGMNPMATRAMHWTREHLSAEAREWLSQLPLTYRAGETTAVHATLDSPGLWGYVLNRFDAMASMSYQLTPLCFCGHTHMARVYAARDGSIEPLPATAPINIEPAGKYLINVGSVGMPRDGDWRASYAIRDATSNEVTVRRVEYDIDETRRKVREAGLR